MILACFVEVEGVVTGVIGEGDSFSFTMDTVDGESLAFAQFKAANLRDVQEGEDIRVGYLTGVSNAPSKILVVVNGHRGVFDYSPVITSSPDRPASPTEAG